MVRNRALQMVMLHALQGTAVCADWNAVLDCFVGGCVNGTARKRYYARI